MNGLFRGGTGNRPANDSLPILARFIGITSMSQEYVAIQDAITALEVDETVLEPFVADLLKQIA